MSIPLRIEDVCDRGFKNAAELTAEELLVYLLADLETLIDMEGWDHFFITDRMRYYSNLINGLLAAGDFVSVEILRDYEKHFSRYGVAFAQQAIAVFLSDEPESDASSGRDWQEEFESAKEVRWKKLEEYLKSRGYEIVG